MIVFSLGCVLMDAKVDAPADPADDTPIVFEVPDGSSARSIGPALLDEGLILDETAWRWFLKTREAGGCLKAGRFELKRSMTMPELMEVMCGVPLADELPFTVVEGWRVRDIDAALAEAGLIEAGAYSAAASDPDRFELPFTIEGLGSLEGFLYPETYMVPRDFAVEGLIQRQVDTFSARFLDGAELGERSLYDVVIVASMLEREEPTPSQRPLVSGIIWKRLDKGWQLGIDATSRYTLENWNDRKAFLVNLKDPEEPYNTRLRYGLPPTPIGNPALSSLQAACEPESSEFWYYLHDSDGVLHPARNGNEHEANRARYGVY